MVRKYVKKTNRRRQEDRHLTVRAKHRDLPDLDKLCQLLIRITLQDMGASRPSTREQARPKPPRPGCLNSTRAVDRERT